jgi:hypothetical protein
MKPSFLLASLLLGIAVPASAQVPGSVANVTFNFTMSFSKPGTVLKDEITGKPITGKDEWGNTLGGPVYENSWTLTKEDKGGQILSEETRDEYIAKLGTRKYGNKEFLTDLVAAGILPKDDNNQPSIAGWSLVQVNGTVSKSDDMYPGEDVFYAVHAKRGLVVLLSGVAIGRDSKVRFSYAENWNFQYSNKQDYVKETEVTTMTENGNWRSVRRYVVDFDDNLTEGDDTTSACQLQGVHTCAVKLTKVRTGNPENPEVLVYQHGPGKLDKITGSGAYYDEDEELREVFEGSFSIAAGKVHADISETYPEAVQR